MAVGRTLQESILKAVRSLEGGVGHIYMEKFNDYTEKELLDYIKLGTDDRIFAIAELMSRGTDLGQILVQGRLEAGGGVGQLDLVQVHPHGDFRGHPGDGVAAGLAGQGRGPGHPGVDLDDVVLEGLGVQGELDVAPALDLQGPDEAQGAVPEEVVLLVGEGLAGGHHDGVAGVDAHGVDVLHIADGDGGVVGVPHHLVLDFLVALDALFNEHLVDGGELQGVLHHFLQLVRVSCEAAAGTAQSEGGTQDHRVADVLRRPDSLVQVVGDLRGNHRLPQLQAQLLEEFPVLGLLDALIAGAQQLHAAYAGTQACLALREEGYQVILANSNPATIMTDTTIADKVYMEPLTVEYLAKILRFERPDAIVPGIGGQTGLNLAMELQKQGILAECGVELLGTSYESIQKADRYPLSWGPGALSGWYWTENTLSFLQARPSTVLSSRLIWVTSRPVPARDAASTA